MDLREPFDLPAYVLWDGILGSILAAVIAALVAVMVVLMTNVSARQSWYDQRRIETFERVLEAFAQCWEISGRDWEDYPALKWDDRSWARRLAAHVLQSVTKRRPPGSAESLPLREEDWPVRVVEAARRNARLQAWSYGLEIPERLVDACPEHPDFDVSQVSTDDPDLRAEVEWEEQQLANPESNDDYQDSLHDLLSRRDQELGIAVRQVADAISLWRLYLKPKLHRPVEDAARRAIEVLHGEWEYSGYLGRGTLQLELPPGFVEEWKNFNEAAARWHRSRMPGKLLAGRRLKRTFRMPTKTRDDIVRDHIGARLRFSIG